MKVVAPQVDDGEEKDDGEGHSPNENDHSILNQIAPITSIEPFYQTPEKKRVKLAHNHHHNHHFPADGEV